jgi:hypothetical protein
MLGLGMITEVSRRYRTHSNEVVRIAIAGCISHVAVETSFHMIDTVNIKSKATPQMASSNFLSLVSKIWAHEGIIGFGRGFSAAFYGSVFAGFTYFFLYKLLKQIFINKCQNKWDVGLIAMAASFCAELVTLLVAYPFDLIKCRLQSVNNIFKYKNLVDAYKKEIKHNGVKSLYIGISPFLVTYCSYVALQFSIYEKLIDMEKKRIGIEHFQDTELRVNCIAGFAAGSIAAALTNGLEAVTVAKQTNPQMNVLKMIKEDGTKLLTRGLTSRVLYNGGQSFVFFSILLQIGKLYSV